MRCCFFFQLNWPFKRALEENNGRKPLLQIESKLLQTPAFPLPSRNVFFFGVFGLKTPDFHFWQSLSAFAFLPQTHRFLSEFWMEKMFFRDKEKMRKEERKHFQDDWLNSKSISSLRVYLDCISCVFIFYLHRTSFGVVFGLIYHHLKAINQIFAQRTKKSLQNNQKYFIARQRSFLSEKIHKSCREEF